MLKAQAVITSIQRTRLTGLGSAAPAPYSGVLTAESVSIDIHGNEARSLTYIDAPNKTVWQFTQSPFSTVDAVTKTVNGLTLQTTSHDNITTIYAYDALRRRSENILIYDL